jgi:hypothetical protein
MTECIFCWGKQHGTNLDLAILPSLLAPADEVIE